MFSLPSALKSATSSPSALRDSSFARCFWIAVASLMLIFSSRLTSPKSFSAGAVVGSVSAGAVVVTSGLVEGFSAGSEGSVAGTVVDSSAGSEG